MEKKKEKYQRLYRAEPKDSMIGGVCAGIANHLNVDPTLIRLLTVLIALAMGSGVLAYLILWLVVPRR
ncbi:MAG: PspC domain-containing protein [Nanoarchaeota archaeon]|nr:PspC domain-containing protein [Nanoarchaeota archaeon]